ncbi:hypothetical protein SAMN05444339_102244 [Loktanella atrilutea]|uniref:Uncharacterized protein n=1 Tax=Loktanella atrilutea TaxID=366533 RepID=A0A1M4WV59_LOKAT|nr:hypothetical protein SAMN05444339_102244 [Loktanella atrilutea]
MKRAVDPASDRLTGWTAFAAVNPVSRRALSRPATPLNVRMHQGGTFGRLT